MQSVSTRAVAAIGAACLVLAARSTQADVIDASASGFTVRTVVTLSRPAVAVYDTLTTHIADWWDAQHTWSGNAGNLSLEARPGGCFCERLPNGGVQHMTVIFADRGRLLRLRGGLGPLQSMAVVGTWSLVLSEAGGVTTLEATYVVGGYAKGGLTALAAPVDQVTAGQLQRLKAFVERP